MESISRAKLTKVQTAQTAQVSEATAKKSKTAVPTDEKANLKTALDKAATLFETRPSKKLTLQKLSRLQGGNVNQSHARFVVDTKNKIAWVPSWVKELRVSDPTKK